MQETITWENGVGVKKDVTLSMVKHAISFKLFLTHTYDFTYIDYCCLLLDTVVYDFLLLITVAYCCKQEAVQFQRKSLTLVNLNDMNGHQDQEVNSISHKG